MATPEVLNKILVVVCMFTQVVAAAGMVILMDLYSSFNAGTAGSNYIVLLVYGFISAIIITLADVVQPKFWKEHVTVFKYFIGRTALYIPYGALVYFDALPQSYDKRGFLLGTKEKLTTDSSFDQQQFAGGFNWAVSGLFFLLAILSVANIQPAGSRLDPLWKTE